MAIIDSIAEIQELLEDHTQYSISLGLTGVPAKGNYPKAKVLINNVEVWDGIVSGTVLSFTTTVLEDVLNIRIEYFNKTDDDTIMENGVIVENQHLKIDYLTCNDIQITGQDIIDVSLTNYNLTDSQKQAYTVNNFSWKNIKTNVLYNNGVWEVNLKKPILPTLIKQKQMTQNIFEISHATVLSKLQQYFKDQ